MTHDRLIDASLLPAMLVPARQADYPRDSRAFVRLDSSLRAGWHTLFDVCPELLGLADPDGLAIYRPFMAWAAEHHLAMDWRLYLWLCVWLEQSPFAPRLNPEMACALAAASAARWAVTDRSAAKGIVIAATGIQGWVAGWKSRTPEDGRHVELIELENVPPLPDSPFASFRVPSFELTEFPGWDLLPLPKPLTACLSNSPRP